jgi:hypothetical protein
MKKQLPTDAISNELAQSVFFPKSPITRPSEGTGELPHARTGEQVINPSPEQANPRTPEVANERTPERSPLPPPVKAITRSPARPNGRTDKQEPPEKTERYSFEIYPTQKERIEEYLYQHKRKTKQKISASRFIRQAIDYYFKTLK